MHEVVRKVHLEAQAVPDALHHVVGQICRIGQEEERGEQVCDWLVIVFQLVLDVPSTRQKEE